MNEELARLYGTNEIINPPSQDELEKQAAAEFLCKIAEQEGVNLDNLSDEQIAELLQSVQEEKKEDAEEGEEPEKTSSIKLAEADYYGRVMAHAYVNELAEIEKQAGKAQIAYDAVKGALGRAARWTGISDIKGGLAQRRAANKLINYGRSRMGDSPSALRELAGEAAGRKMMAGKKQALQGAKQLATRVGLPLAGLAAVGTGGNYAVKKSLEKKSYNESIEELAQERAYEILAEQGLLEKQAATDVEYAALKMLENAGYQINWG